MPVSKKINVDFFKQWTPEMAYTLGFFAADGNMVASTRGNHYFAFYSADRDILLKMKRAMCSDHKLSKRTSASGAVFRFQVGSKTMYEDLVNLGFSAKKAARMKLPTIPKLFIGDFIRGYFDGDGNVWYGKMHKERKTSSVALMVAFTSVSRGFLESLLLLIKQEGIIGGSVCTSHKKNFSRLQFSTLDALKLAEIMYNERPKLYLKRKKLRFDQFKNMRA